MKKDKEFGKAMRTLGISGKLWLRFFDKGIIISNRNQGKVRLNWIDAFIIYEELKRLKENNETLKELEVENEI